MMRLWLFSTLLAINLLCCHGNMADNRTEVHILILDSPVMPNIYYPFAIDYVNNLTEMFPNFRLNALRLTTEQYDTGSATKRFIDGYFSPPQKALVIGPFLSQQAQSVADVAKHYHVTEIGSTGTSPALSDKKAYPYYFRMCGIDSQYTGLIIKLLLKYKWRRVALLTADSTGLYPVALELENAMLAHNITQYEKIIFSREPSDRINVLVEKDIRIFIIVRIVFYEYFDKRLECQIAKYKLYGPKYQWIQLGFTQTSAPFLGGCDRAEAAAALEGSLEFDSSISDISFPRPTSLLGMSAVDMLDELISYDPSTRRMAQASTIYGLDLKFDSILAAALAINRTLQTEVYNSNQIVKGNSSFKKVLLDSVKALDFVGLSGRVSFNSNNDRSSIFLVYQIRNLTRDLVATFDPETGELNWLKSVWFSGSNPPVDSFKLELTQIKLSRASLATIVAVSSAGVLLSALALTMNIRYRKESAISRSSPLANDCFAIGCLVCYLGCIVMATNAQLGPTIELCWTQTGLMTCGYSVAMGALLAKMWQAHLVFAGKRLRSSAVTKWQVFAAISALIFADAALLLAWAGVDPLQLDRIDLGATEMQGLSKIIRHQVILCRSKSYKIWIITLFGVKATVLFFGVFFAWETRNIRLSGINDSRQAAWCLYNTSAMGFIGLVLWFTLPSGGIELSVCLLAACVTICLTASLALLFGHKVLMLTGHVTESQDATGFTDPVWTNRSNTGGPTN